MNYPISAVNESLRGSLLVSSPMLVGEVYEHSVVFIYEHSSALGANGTIINHQSRLSVDDLFEKAGYAHNGTYASEPLYHGGLISEQSILMLHSPEWYSSSTHPIDEKFSISSDTFMIEKLVSGNQPDRWRMCAGQCSWSPGQLEMELEKNVWLTTPATHNLVFNRTGDQAQWRKAIRECSSSAVESWF